MVKMASRLVMALVLYALVVVPVPALAAQPEAFVKARFQVSAAKVSGLCYGKGQVGMTVEWLYRGEDDTAAYASRRADDVETRNFAVPAGGFGRFPGWIYVLECVLKDSQGRVVSVSTTTFPRR